MSEVQGVASYPRAQRLKLVTAIVLSVLISDHLTKWGANVWLKDSPPIIYWGDLFRFQYATNPGAFLSMFAGLSAQSRTWLLVGFNAVILTGVAVYLASHKPVSKGSAIALALILSGGVGNLLDRMFRGGLVVDFMNVGIAIGKFSIRSGIFNIADLAIVGGLIMLVGVEVFGRRPAAE